MIVHLKEMQIPRHFDLRFGPNWWKEGEAIDQVLGLEGPLEVHLTIFKEESHYVVNGNLSGKIRARCDRCLDAYSQEVQSEFKLLLEPQPPQPAGSEVALSEQDMSIDFLVDDAIEIDLLVREQIYLALPIKLLCHESCRGICPGCGANLNREECTCRDQRGHPAFLKLKNLRVDRKENNGPSV